GLLKHPTFGWSHLDGGGPGKTTCGVELYFLGLLLAAPRQRIENVRFKHTRLRVTQAVLRHAAETRKAWAEALAAVQTTGLLGQVNELAQVEADLAARQRKAGNISERDLLLRQAFAAETRTAQLRAAETANAVRERLNRLMGLGNQHAAWTLPPRMPGLPAEQPRFDDLENYGLRQRLDLQMVQKEAEAFSTALGLTRSTRFINVLDLGVETETNVGEKRITGPTLRIELPIFDQGQARISKQEAQYRQSEMRLYDSVVVARSEIREAQQRLATAWQTATEAREVLSPLRRRIVEQSALQYNGMLIGVYELLAAARDQVNAAQVQITAVRDYWTALADLQMAVGGKLPPESAAMAGQEGYKK
ncbi:MAG TPA: TolC family protein, partial [Methylophilaceae bacterium]|nr:TolC family protein [Methylophilaceae bacterium]